jgi:hypothetical protein
MRMKHRWPPKVDNLKADLVDVVFHPPGFFVFGLADRI